MDRFSLNNCPEETHVDIRLLRYIMVLLNISKEDLMELRSFPGETDQDQPSLFITKQTKKRCEECIKCLKSKRMP